MINVRFRIQKNHLTTTVSVMSRLLSLQRQSTDVIRAIELFAKDTLRETTNPKGLDWPLRPSHHWTDVYERRSERIKGFRPFRKWNCLWTESQGWGDQYWECSIWTRWSATKMSKRYLNTFWTAMIGRRSSTKWPASTDLSPLDVFLWAYSKSEVYETKPESTEELGDRIIVICAITPTQPR